MSAFCSGGYICCSPQLCMVNQRCMRSYVVRMETALAGAKMFDEEPDAPLHGECALEIANLKRQLEAAEKVVEAARAFLPHTRELPTDADNIYGRLEDELKAALSACP